MKKIIFTLLLFLGIAGPLCAQIVDDELDKPTLERVRAQRVAFITNKLELTTGEAEKFWALENEYEAEKEKIREKYRAGRSIESMSDQEADRFIQDRFTMEGELLSLKKDYYQRFIKIVSPRKIALYNKADREFKRWLLEQIRKRRLNQRGRFRDD